MKILTANASFGENNNEELKILQRTVSSTQNAAGYSRIVQLLDHFEHVGLHGVHICLILEVLGPSLTDVQQFYMTQQQTIPAKVAKRFVRQVLLGLDYLHRFCNIVHTGDLAIRV